MLAKMKKRFWRSLRHNQTKLFASKSAEGRKEFTKFGSGSYRKTKKEQLLMVKDKKWGWNFPGGKIEADETPLAAAKREVFEETNLVIENCEMIAEENIFFANLEKGNQHWRGYFYRTNKYSGEIKIKETKKILDIKFVDYHSPEAREGRRAYQKFFRDYQKYGK